MKFLRTQWRVSEDCIVEDQEELVTCEVVAERLGVHVATVREWVREDKLPAYRLGERFVRLDWGAVLVHLATSSPAPAGSETARDGRQR